MVQIAQWLSWHTECSTAGASIRSPCRRVLMTSKGCRLSVETRPAVQPATACLLQHGLSGLRQDAQLKQTIVAEQVNTHQLRSFSGMQNSRRELSRDQHDTWKFGACATFLLKKETESLQIEGRLQKLALLNISAE